MLYSYYDNSNIATDLLFVFLEMSNVLRTFVNINVLIIYYWKFVHFVVCEYNMRD